MISKQEIIEIAKQLGLELRIVEKDYVLGWVLAVINQHPELQEKWIFKGGTCLKKNYFENYRFSQDLDFTVIDLQHLNLDFLKQVFEQISDSLYSQVGISLPFEQMKFDIHPDPSKGYVEGRLYYTGPLLSTAKHFDPPMLEFRQVF
jgi:predicted nucleotidyltransferase component of viral defense system